MRDLVTKKFVGISHKWLTVPLDSPEFNVIKNTVIEEVKKKNPKFNSNNAKDLANAFKEKGFCWIKFTRLSGRKKLISHCQIIDKNNYKIDIELSPQSILELPLLNGTPKSLKLYKSGEKIKHANWKKPDDGFYDTYEIPLDEEFTEAGYILYKDFHDELKEKGITLEEWHKQKGGPNWRF